MHRNFKALALIMLVSWALPQRATAQVQVPPPERLCDPQFEDCREPILDLIRNESIGIDVAFWFMEDTRYANELIKRHNAGVPVRIIVDQRANATKRLNEQTLGILADSGIPMREKFAGPDILHWKVMLFHGQNMLEWSKANYAPSEFVPDVPNSNYSDEAIFFTNDDRLTNTFRRRYEDLWTDTSIFRDFANMTGPPSRIYPLYPLDPSMNFPPLQDFSNRAVARFNRETRGIDAIVFRAYDDRETNALVAAVARGVPVRLITEPTEYRNPLRVFDSEHFDRMYVGGAQIKIRNHLGLTHEGSIVLRGLGEVIFGSSNWTPSAAINSDEHNFFYTPSFNKPWFFDWFADQFDRKWNDTANYVPFQPLPPDVPSYSAPGNGISGQGSSVTLRWEGGPWAHFYDIYFGISSSPPLYKSNQQLGSPQDGVIETLSVTSLQPGTTYYWRIVSKTWAQITETGPTWSFTTAGSAPPGGGSTPFGGTPRSVPGTFQAEDFDEGGQFVAYSDVTAGNSGGVYRSTDVDLEATTDTGGGYDVMKTRAGEWMNYTINVTGSGTYPLDIRIANIGTGGKFHVEIDGVDKTGPIAVPDTGGWQTWQTVTTPGIALSAGTHVVRVALDVVASTGGVGNYNWFRFTGTATPPPPPPPPNTPFGGTPASVPGVVQSENFDNGGQSLAWSDTTAGNSGGVYRTGVDVDLEPTTDAGGGYDVMKTRAGEWLKYTVNVTAGGTYPLAIRVANIGTGGRFHVEVDGVDQTGAIALPDTGGWQIWQTVTVPSVSLTSGQHVIRFVFDAVATTGGVGNYNWFQIGE
jgi:hypothetical protein